MFKKHIWFDCNQFDIHKISLEMTTRFSKNIFKFRLVFTGQKLTVLIFVSKVNRSAKLTLLELAEAAEKKKKKKTTTKK